VGDGIDEGLLVNRMNIPDRIVTLMELRRNTGERGTRKFIVFGGIVYDVAGCPKWRGDLHENMHFPGQDLSADLAEAPHGSEVFLHPCVVVVGRLEA